MTYYNCDGRAELEALRADPRGTNHVELSELLVNHDQPDMLSWQGYNVYLLAADNNWAEVFIP